MGHTTAVNRGMAVRALLEGLAFSCRSALFKLELLTAVRVDKIMLLGGAARNPLLCQMISDATNRELIAVTAEATAVGNLAIQLVACGEVDSPIGIREIMTNSFPMPVYAPMAPAKRGDYAERRAGLGE